MVSEDNNRLVEDRKKKLESLKELGINPYPYKFEKRDDAKTLQKEYSGLKPETDIGKEVSVAGRIMLLRNMGKIIFLTLMDEDDKIQILIQKNVIGEEKYKLFKKIELGDWLGVKGKLFITRTGELTVKAEETELLCKAIRPLPEKHHGLKDKELRYRRRYLDLIMNPDVKEVLKKRSLILKYIREFMESKGFLEVETPLLQTQYGGANARPFITHINAWDMKMYLSISPELYLKRLIVGGYEKVYTICKNFRNEGVDQSHNPEFTMLEAYQAYADYNDMMILIEECYEYVALKINGTTKIKRIIDGKEIVLDFKAPWPRITLLEAIEEHLGIDATNMKVDELKQILDQKGVNYENELTWGLAVYLLFDELVEDKYIQPTHIIDRPRESTPLCKVHRDDYRLIEQNEPVAVGMELGNMYSELNDPILQRELLEEQAAELRAGSDEAHPMDEDFVQAIEYGMPPTGGIGFGIDRMAILLLGQESIRDVLLFPTMKPEQLKNKNSKNTDTNEYKEKIEKSDLTEKTNNYENKKIEK